MAFFKRTFAKRFDMLFRRRRRGKFVECVHKVIEARRSGCIDEDGNILKPLTEMLAAHEKLNKGAGSNGAAESVSEEALKAEPRTRNTHRPLARQQVVSIRDSYPLPEEDDGSEGYASAGETDDSFNPTAFLERNRRTSSRRFSNNSEEGGHSNRRVRFSDEVQQFGGLDSEDVLEEPTVPPSAEPEEPPEEPDLSSLPLVRKIEYFEEVMTRLKKERLRIKKLDGTLDQPPSPCPGSPEIRHRVKLFEDISKGIHIEPPPPKPRRAVQSCQYTQTKSKINFFEQLSHEC